MKYGYTFVADEFNLSGKNAVQSFNSLFEQDYMELPSGKFYKDDNFEFIATQNPE